MKIALVLECAGGGTGRYVIDLARGLLEQGHEVTVFYSPVRLERWFETEMQSLERLKTVTVRMTRSPGPSDLFAAFDLCRKLRKYGPYDIIHANSSKAGALCRLISWFTKGKQIYNPHAFRVMDPNLGSVSRKFYSVIEKYLDGFFGNGIIVGSEQELAVARQIGIKHQRVRIIVNGIQAVDLPDRRVVRERLGLPQDAFVLGFVGRLAHQKAPTRLLDALDLLQDLNLSVAIVGSGELEEQLRSIVDEKKLNQRVHFCGPYHGQHAMAAMDALIVPSRYESMGYIFLEACVAQIPVIAAPVGIAMDVISDGETGVIVENTDDPRPWAAAIREVCDPEQYALMHKVCKKQTLRFTHENMVRQTCSFYQQTLDA